MSLFYEITNKSGKKSYLFGTLHITNNEELVRLPLEVKKALQNTTKHIFEVDISQKINIYSVFIIFIKWFVKQNFTNCDDKEYLKNIRQFVNNKRFILSLLFKIFPDRFVDDICRWVGGFPIIATASFKKNTPNSLDLSKKTFKMDEQLLIKAKKDEKEVCFLESIEDQIKSLYGLKFTYRSQIDFYNSMINDPISEVLTYENTMAAYLSQDISQLENDVLLFLNREDLLPVVKQYYEDFVSNRDTIMAEKLNTHIEGGDVFIAIGSLHLKGVCAQLEKMGYLVKPITTGERSHFIPGSIEDTQKLINFRKIYHALYAGQTSLFKSLNEKMLSTDDMNDVVSHAGRKPNSRTAKALELSQRYFSEGALLDNNELFGEIHKYSFQCSSLTFFRKSKNFTNHNYGDDTKTIREAASPYSRTGLIHAALN